MSVERRGGEAAGALPRTAPLIARRSSLQREARVDGRPLGGRGDAPAGQVHPARHARQLRIVSAFARSAISTSSVESRCGGWMPSRLAESSGCARSCRRRARPRSSLAAPRGARRASASRAARAPRRRDTRTGSSASCASASTTVGASTVADVGPVGTTSVQSASVRSPAHTRHAPGTHPARTRHAPGTHPARSGRDAGRPARPMRASRPRCPPRVRASRRRPSRTGRA